MPRRRPLTSGHPAERLIGHSQAIVDLRTQIRRLATFDAVGKGSAPTLLLCGETSTGKELVTAGHFRADLYYRLAVVMLDIPPLRAWVEDVVVLVQHFLRHYAEAHGLVPKRLTAAAEGWVRGYGWPGNVRELSHLMERVTLLRPETILDPHTLEQLCLPHIESASPAVPEQAAQEGGPADGGGGPVP